MSDFLQMIILAVVQGLTEFLPVSSSGHLVLFQHFMQTREGDVFFDIVLHVGTLGSVLVVYFREVVRLLRFDQHALKYILSLVVGTMPAVLVGLLAKDALEALFHSPVFAAAGLLYTAALLLSTRFHRKNEEKLPEPWQPRPIPLGRALVIGLFQAVAIMPGVSRSGSTIAASLWLGLPRAEAARFSFLLSIPAIGGALVLQLVSGAGAAQGDIPALLLAALAAFGVGLLAIRWTALAVVQAHFWKFCFYCLAAGIIALVILT